MGPGLAAQLKALHVFDWTTIFGAELLWSALPFIILLSSLANERIDDDLSRHIGLNSQGAQIVEHLFRHRPAHATIAILTGLLFSFAGSIAVVSSLQLLYERVFDQQHRARDFLRQVTWVGVFLAAALSEVVVGRPVRTAAGPVAQALLGRSGGSAVRLDDALSVGRTGAMALRRATGPRHCAAVGRSRRLFLELFLIHADR